MICQYLGLFCLYFGILTLTVFASFHRQRPALLTDLQFVYAHRTSGVHFIACSVYFSDNNLKFVVETSFFFLTPFSVNDSNMIVMYMLETYFDLKMDNAFCITIIAS